MLRSIGRDNLLVMLSLLLWALGEGLWYNLRQLYLVRLGAGPVDVGTALAMESIGKALVLLPAGYGIDRIGARQTMLASWIIGIAGVGVMALARTWPGAALGLMLYGASAFAIPAVSAYALLSIPGGDNPVGVQGVLTAVFATYPLGLIVSPTLGGLLAERAGIGACLVAAVVLYCVSMGVVLTTRHFEPHPAQPGYRVDALLHNRAYRWRALYFAGGIFALVIGYNLLPNFLNDVRLLDVAAIGLLFSVMSAGTTAISLGAGRMPRKWSYPAVLALGWLALIGLWRIPAFAGIIASFFALGAIFVARPLAVAGVERVVAPQERGMAFAALEMLVALATAVASQLAGELYKLSPAHDVPLIAGLVALPVMAGLWFAARVWRGDAAQPGLSAEGAASID